LPRSTHLLRGPKGYTGQGVTIGIVDTGLDSRHPAIAPHYRGTKADGTQDNNYNWYDPTAGAQSPLDDGEHGTHVAGTSAGGTDGHVTGVAPGAKLIAAKAILGSGYNTTEATLKALQWMLAPTDLAGKHADPTRGADVINNSWGDADHQDTMFQDTWDAMNAAGIIIGQRCWQRWPARHREPSWLVPERHQRCGVNQR